jgi:hypothetical protein
MAHEPSRRCAVWVSPGVLIAAQELADLLGVDVDTFVETTVLALHEQEAVDGRLRARTAAATKSSNRRVIPVRSGGSKRA